MQDWKSDFSGIVATIYFSKKEYLRERTVDVVLVRLYIEKGLPVLREAGEVDRYIIRGMIGNLYRIIDETDAAVHMLTENVAYASRLKTYKKEAVSRIRLGEAYKYAGDYEKALEEFERANEIINSHSFEELRDFVYQHLGKLYIEKNDVDQAREFFKKAYSIRIEKGDEELLASTEAAYAYINELNGIKDP